MRKIRILRLEIILAMLLGVLGVGGCKSDQYTQEQAVESARRFLLRKSPELTLEQTYFVKFTEPVLLLSQEFFPADKNSKSLGASPRQICPAWLIPGQDKIYLVFGVSSGRMSSWEPIRLIRRNFNMDSYRTLDSLCRIARQFAVNNFYKELDAVQLNRIRFQLPYIYRTNFEYMPEFSFKLNAEQSKEEESESETGQAENLELTYSDTPMAPEGEPAALPKLEEAGAGEVETAPLPEEQEQYTLVWYLSEDESKAIVFCGFSPSGLRGWALNWAGIVDRDELKQHTLEMLGTPSDNEVLSLSESESDAEHTFESNTEAKSEPVAEPEPGAESKPEAESKPDTELKPEAESKPEAEPKPDTELKPEAEPKSESELKPEAETQTDAEPEVKLEPEAKTTVEMAE